MRLKNLYLVGFLFVTPKVILKAKKKKNLQKKESLISWLCAAAAEAKLAKRRRLEFT